MVYLVPSVTQWRYTATDPGNKGWTQSLPYWTSYTTGQFPTASSTRYYANTVTVTESFKSKAVWEAFVYSAGGFILYINGEEVDRVNLPSYPIAAALTPRANVGHNTLCLAEPPAPSWHRVTLPGYKYNSTSYLLVAVEMHPCTTSPVADEFKAIVLPSALGACALRT